MGKEMGRDDHYNEENLEIDEASVLEHPKYEELQEKLVQAETKINEYWNEILRAKADVENMRKRFEKDLSHAHKYGLEKFVQNLLPVVDSIERGLESTGEAKDEFVKNIQNGMKLTSDMLIKVLDQAGITQVKPLGEEFNPELHEAMSAKEDPKEKPNTILEVLQKGYLLNGRLLRPALVIVSKNI